MLNSRLLSATAAAIVAIGLAASVSHADEPWETLLRQQLEDKHKCVLSGVVFVRELPFEDTKVYSGRAKCFDGREFDFSQEKPHMTFVIRACEPTVC